MDTNDKNGAEKEVNSIDWLGCPFCGSMPITDYDQIGYKVRCPDCGIQTPDRYGALIYAQEFWNTRHPNDPNQVERQNKETTR